MAKEPPVAPRREHKTMDGRLDYYHWLRDSKWPVVEDKEILDYLNKENEYARAHLSQELEDSIFEELKGRIKESDKTVPYLDGDYYYYSYIKKGQEYWIHARRHKDEKNEDKEEILIDENELAKDQAFFDLNKLDVTCDHSKVVYSVDVTGGERSVAYVKDLAKGTIVDEAVDDIMYGEFELDELGQGFFYSRGSEFLRTDKIYYHKFGTNKKDDMLVYYELDTTFSLGMQKSASKDYIFIVTASYVSKEVYYLDSRKPHEDPKMLYDRSNDDLYDLVHNGDHFYLCIDDTSSNFRVVKVPIHTSNQKETWEELVPASDVYLKKIFAYKDHLVLLKLCEGLDRVEIINLKDGARREIKMEDETYEITVIQNTFKDSALRYIYSSLKTPRSTTDYNFETGEKTVRKVQEIPSGFDSSKYVLKRIWIEASDGVKVPVSLIYNREKAKLDGTDPLLLYGYGSYGLRVKTSFRDHIFTILDRGFTYAVAHIRGGDELGKSWHDAAKFLTKKKTFTDFIESAEKLIELKYTSKGNISIQGASAGGLLLGYCLNTRPELFKAALLGVPFVDLMNSMLDESLPLTPSEFHEWGNPKEKKFYDYMLSYSPYDNIKAQNYPNVLVLSGLSDIRVQYWEPAKWVAALRHAKLDNNMLLLFTDMSSGHKGPSGRFLFLKDYAKEYSFILSLYGMK